MFLIIKAFQKKIVGLLVHHKAIDEITVSSFCNTLCFVEQVIALYMLIFVERIIDHVFHGS